MPNITIRNISPTLMEKLRMLSDLDRRSLNSELLIAIEHGIVAIEEKRPLHAATVSTAAQIALWKGLSGTWKDVRTKEAQIKELHRDRTMGREVSW